MHRQMGAQSEWDRNLPAGVGRNARLERIAALLDWAPLAALVAGIYAKRTGRPSYPPLVMVKVLLLQQWYNASDPEMEAALGDRLSFRRFVGLGLADPTPDHSTISRFRAEVSRRGLAGRLFEVVSRQLDAQGLVVKQGTLLDATLVAAQVRPPPPSAGLGARSPGDPDATWTRSGRSRQGHFGYKAHLGVDADSGLIRTVQLTSAQVNESAVADGLVSGDEGAVYADRAYESQRRRHWLKARGIKDRILHRSHKHQAQLPYWQRRRNALIAPRRAAVEKVFGTLKRSYQYTRVRYRGLARNATEWWCKCIAYNLRRAETLSAAAGA